MVGKVYGKARRRTPRKRREGNRVERLDVLRASVSPW